MIHLQHQTRFIDNASEYGYSYFDAGGLFRITKNLRYTFNYIFADKRRIDQSFSYRHQLEGYFTYRKRFGKFVFFDRLLNDMQFKDYYSDAQGKRLRDFYIRNKVTLRYKLPYGITPYIEKKLILNSMVLITREGSTAPVYFTGYFTTSLIFG